MPYRRVVKVSESVYEMLQELVKRLNVESPNQALEMLLRNIHGVTLSTAHGVTPLSTKVEKAPESVHGVTPSPIRVEKREDPFWLNIIVGEGHNTERIALNIIQYEKLCRIGLLPSVICSNK